MDPETGGIYEHKLATMLGYPLTQDSQPPAEFIAAAKMLEEQGYVHRLRRNPNIETMGIFPTPKGLEEVECLSPKLTLLRALGAPIPTAPVDQSVTRYDFFIAYASPDRRHAEDLCWLLEDHSCKVFLDIEDLRPGALWQPALREALEASHAIVVLISTHADNAFYQQEEIARAIQLVRDKPNTHPLIPVILEQLPQGAASMPYGMIGMQALDATRAGGLKRVAAELVKMSKKL